MRQWKYFYLNDSEKETCGTLYAENINEAYLIASRMKQLPIKEFKDIFGIDRL